jgi:hypothetical protein
MARTAMTVDTRPAGYSITPVALAAEHSFDQANGMTLAINGQTGLSIRNPTAGAITVTIHSTADPYGRSQDITAYSIPAGGVAIFQEFPTAGWGDPNNSNLLSIDASATGLVYLAIQRHAGT